MSTEMTSRLLHSTIYTCFFFSQKIQPYLLALIFKMVKKIYGFVFLLKNMPKSLVSIGFFTKKHHTKIINLQGT